MPEPHAHLPCSAAAWPGCARAAVRYAGTADRPRRHRRSRARVVSFVQALLAHEFLRVALAAGLLAAVGCGIIGTLVVVRRITFMAGGIAHAVLGGMGISQLLDRDPLVGAAIAAVVAALLVGWIARHGGEREDMLIGALWAVGMAVGIVAIAHTPGYSTDLMSYLLGNLLMVSREQMIMMAWLNGLMVLVVLAFWRPLVATTFDEEFARLRGLPTLAIELGILVAVALAVVLLVQAVGLVLVMALLTLPAATALLLSSRGDARTWRGTRPCADGGRARYGDGAARQSQQEPLDAGGCDSCVGKAALTDLHSPLAPRSRRISARCSSRPSIRLMRGTTT